MSCSIIPFRTFLIAFFLLVIGASLVSVYLFKVNCSPDVTSNNTFIDITSDSGLDRHLRPAIYNENPGYLEVMGGGVAVGDYDNDGWEDIFFATMSSFAPELQTDKIYRSALFRNQGDGTFSEETKEAGLINIKGYPFGGLFFDFNNDGYQDLYVASFDGGQLFENKGGFFVDITDSAGLSLEGLCGNYPCMVAAATAADYNKNGYLDLLIVNNVNWDIENPMHYGLNALLPWFYPAQPSFLFRNNGDGTFTNVSEPSGISNLDPRGYREGGKGLSAVWTDVDNNGWPDLFIANDMSPNRLYINNENGTFREVGPSAGVDEVKSNMGIDAADYNYDGLLDFVSTNLEGQMISLFRNFSDYRFDYATTQSGLLSSSWGSGWGVLFVDWDLDGHLDLVIASGALWSGRQKEKENENRFFKNQGNGTFQDITENIVNFSNDARSRGMSDIDVNRNGKPDLIISNIDGSVSQLLLNQTKNNNWLKIDLKGERSNRDAVGAKVYIEREDGLKMNQLVKAGNSYQSSGSKSLFFGLANSTPKELVIHWPSGSIDRFDDLPYNEILSIQEGKIEGQPAVIMN